MSDPTNELIRHMFHHLNTAPTINDPDSYEGWLIPGHLTDRLRAAFAIQPGDRVTNERWTRVDTGEQIYAEVMATYDNLAWLRFGPSTLSGHTSEDVSRLTRAAEP